MKTVDGNYVVCSFSGKRCYTEREAGLVINHSTRYILDILKELDNQGLL